MRIGRKVDKALLTFNSSGMSALKFARHIFMCSQESHPLKCRIRIEFSFYFTPPGLQESSASSRLAAPFALELKVLNSSFRRACQPSRWMPLHLRREGPENWAQPSNQHKQSLKPPFPKSLMKGKWVWQRKWRDGGSQNVTRRLQSKQDFWTQRKEHKRLMPKLRMSCPHKNKSYISNLNLMQPVLSL